MNVLGYFGSNGDLRLKLSPKGHRNRRLAIIVHSGQRGFGAEPLEHAIQAVNKFIFEHEQQRQRQRASRANATGHGRTEVEVPPISRPITFKASARTEKLVKEPAGPSPSPRGLSDYLALPLDQYSLLDPGWISRSPAAPDVFVLRIPLFDLVGLELQPQISVRVSLDPRNNQVHFLADQFKVGDPRFDEDFKLHMRATLRNKPVPTLRPFRSIRRMWARAGMGGGASGTAANVNGGSGAAEEAVGAASTTASVVDVQTDTDTDTPAGAAAAAAAARASSLPGAEDGGHTLQAEGAGTAAAPEPLSQRRGAPGVLPWGSRHDSSSDRSYDPAAVLDVGLQAGARQQDGGSGSSSSRGSAPDLPPHVRFGPPPHGAAAAEAARQARSAAAGATAGGGSGWRTGGSEAAAGSAGASSDTRGSSGQCTNAAHVAHGKEVSSSGSGRPSSLGTKGNGVASNGTTASPHRVTATGRRGTGDAGAPSWPSGEFGPSHPTTAATAPQPMAPRPLSHPPSRPHAAPLHASAQAAVGRVPQGSQAATSVVVAPAATASSSLLESTGAKPSAAVNDARPFIEDEVLYVPASQWGRTGGDPAPTGKGGLPAQGGTPPGAAAALAAGAAAGPALLSAGAQPGPSQSGHNGSSHSAASVVTVTVEAQTVEPGSRPSGKTGQPAVAESVPSRVLSAGYTGGVGSASSGSGGTTMPLRASGGAPSSSLPPSASSAACEGAGPASSSPSTPHGSESGASEPALSVQAATGTAASLPATIGAPAAGPNAGESNADSGHGGSSSNNGSSTSIAAAGKGADTALAVTSSQPTGAGPGASAAGAASAASAGGGGGGAAVGVSEDGATALLVGAVDVEVTVMLPPALAAVPRPLLGMTGSLIARYAISSLLPSFLDLLVADYGRWSSGQTVSARSVPVGDLAATAAANAVAMGAAGAGRSALQQVASAAVPDSAAQGQGDAKGR